MFKQVDYIMVYVSDMKRSIEFYRDKLGLPLKFESDEWTEFQTGVTTLALHGGAKKTNNAKKGETPIAGICSIGFAVENIEQTFQALRSKGVEFTMPPSVQEEEGIKLAVCTDPDGFTISIAEPLHKS